MGEVDIVSNAKSVKKDIIDGMKRGLKIIGMQAESYAKMLAPVDTGLLRNSITHALGGENPANPSYTDDSGTVVGQYEGSAPPDNGDTVTLYVGTNVHYAPYQELGHATVDGGFVDPQPFLRPAIENHVDEYKRILMNELSK